jgi:hypothetical protein
MIHIMGLCVFGDNDVERVLVDTLTTQVSVAVLIFAIILIGLPKSPQTAADSRFAVLARLVFRRRRSCSHRL